MLRMLCRAFAEGEGGVRVAVVDTRREFSPRDAEGTFMDILSGYPRQSGALIALRTLSPSVLGMDEIGCDADTEALLEVMRAGVQILATAHARGAQDIYRRRHLKRSVEAGVFDTVLSLSREGSTLGARLCHL